VQDHFLPNRENAVIAPLMAFHNREVSDRILKTTPSNIENLVRKMPQNLVNGEEIPDKNLLSTLGNQKNKKIPQKIVLTIQFCLTCVSVFLHYSAVNIDEIA